MKPGGRSIEAWIETFPLLRKIMAGEEVFWGNPGYSPYPKEGQETVINGSGIKDAEARLQRFAPFIAKTFPETREAGGIIESPLIDITGVKGDLRHLLRKGETHAGAGDDGSTLLLKRDSHLPISGSVKARGGIYEVLKHAEELALQEGLIGSESDYSILAEARAKDFFSRFSLAVGSTGNLGMSIGIMGAALGFRVTVHMSSDAKEWKKRLLRERGVKVVEHPSDYGKAVEEGRKEAEGDPTVHFIDDENSMDLFFGYSAAAPRLKRQLDEQGITVDEEHPLFVYLPCGVGGGPGGISFGLKEVFRDSVHCFFAEPTQAPSMLLGLLTGLHDKVSVYDFGLTNRTNADGLACARPSALVGKLMGRFISGVFTVQDDTLYSLLRLLKKERDIFLEPSALAGFPGPVELLSSPGGAEYLSSRGLLSRMDQACHIVWATGGSMVPREEMEAYLKV